MIARERRRPVRERVIDARTLAGRVDGPASSLRDDPLDPAPAPRGSAPPAGGRIELARGRIERRDPALGTYPCGTVKTAIDCAFDPVDRRGRARRRVDAREHGSEG